MAPIPGNMPPMATRRRRGVRPQTTLSIDIGGTGLKASVLDAEGRMTTERVRVPTPSPCTPEVLVDALTALVEPLPAADRVSVGFPGVVRGGVILTAPHWGNAVWNGFPLGAALGDRLGKPVRVLNDADMQGLAVVKGEGVELVLTLGTGVGSALFRRGVLMPHLELAHHPIAKGKTYNEYLGEAARKKIGSRRWNKRVGKMLEIVRILTTFDTLYLGGGNSDRVTLDLPRDVHRVDNSAGILGGIALWREDIEL